jgi:hypothetical protein
MDRVGIPKGVPIRGQRLGCERFGPAAPQIEGVRIVADHPLRQRVRLGQERPMPPLQHEAAVGSSPCLAGRDDIEDRKPLDTLRMVQGHAVRAVRASVVSGDEEAVEAEATHHGHLISRHGSLGLGRVIGRGPWL